ncbi:MAG: hypothetical protein JSW56_12405 [Deltaproteobacteria bacterium]|nr:MAG: hypothetical protein JSW56_12405 [Deltaproteobacteria bacterium]
MLGQNNVVARLLAIQHRLNPLHVYCRFLDMGLNKKFSTSLCKLYGIILFIWLNWTLKAVVHLCCAIDRACTVEQEMKKQ